MVKSEVKGYKLCEVTVSIHVALSFCPRSKYYPLFHLVGKPHMSLSKHQDPLNVKF
jgi:hypothetical protein